MSPQFTTTPHPVIPLIRSAQTYLTWEMSWVLERIKQWFNRAPEEGEGDLSQLILEQKENRKIILKQRAQLDPHESIGLEALHRRFALTPFDEEALLLIASPILLDQAREITGSDQLSLQDVAGLCGPNWRSAILKLLSLGWLEISEALSPSPLSHPAPPSASPNNPPQSYIRILGDITSALLGVHALDPRLSHIAWLQTLSNNPSHPLPPPTKTPHEPPDPDDLARRTLLWYQTPEVEQAVARYVAASRGHHHLITILCDELEDRAQLMEILDLASRSACFHSAALHLCGLTRPLRARPALEPLVKRWIDNYCGDIIVSGDDIPTLGWDGLHLCEHFGHTPSNPRGTSLAALQLRSGLAMNGDQ